MKYNIPCFVFYSLAVQGAEICVQTVHSVRLVYTVMRVLVLDHVPKTLIVEITTNVLTVSNCKVFEQCSLNADSVKWQ